MQNINELDDFCRERDIKWQIVKKRLRMKYITMNLILKEFFFSLFYMMNDFAFKGGDVFQQNKI